MFYLYACDKLDTECWASWGHEMHQKGFLSISEGNNCLNKYHNLKKGTDSMETLMNGH